MYAYTAAGSLPFATLIFCTLKVFYVCMFFIYIYKNTYILIHTYVCTTVTVSWALAANEFVTKTDVNTLAPLFATLFASSMSMALLLLLPAFVPLIAAATVATLVLAQQTANSNKRVINVSPATNRQSFWAVVMWLGSAFAGLARPLRVSVATWQKRYYYHLERCIKF